MSDNNQSLLTSIINNVVPFIKAAVPITDAFIFGFIVGAKIDASSNNDPASIDFMLDDDPEDLDTTFNLVTPLVYGTFSAAIAAVGLFALANDKSTPANLSRSEIKLS